MTDQQLLQLLAQLARTGRPLASALGGATGSQGLGLIQALISLARGGLAENIPALAGGALGAGQNIANLLGQTQIGGLLGAAGGPLAIGTNLAQGNLAGAAAATPGAVSAGASALGTAGAITPELASAISGSLGAIALPAALAYMIAGTDTHGDVLFSPRDRMKEYRDAAAALPASWQKWLQASGEQVNDQMTPQDVAKTFQDITQGVRAQEFSPAFDLITRGQGSKNPGLHDNPKPYIPGKPMPELEAAAPAVTGKAWDNWVKALDRAEQLGVDWRSLAGGNRQQAPVTDYQHQAINIAASGENGANSPGGYNWAPGQDPNRTTQEAYDLSQAIYGTAMAQGRPLDGPLPGARGGGGYLAPDQLAEMGFTPGHYADAIQHYLDHLQDYGPAQLPTAPPSNGPLLQGDTASGGE